MTKIDAVLHRATGALTTLTNGRHAWTSDVPKTLGSLDAAPDPHDLLDSALAACTVLTLELYIRRKPDWSVSRFECSVERLSEKKGDDGRIHYSVKRSVRAIGELSADQHARLLEIANKCPIHRLLEGQVTIETEILPEETR